MVADVAAVAAVVLSPDITVLFAVCLVCYASSFVRYLCRFVLLALHAFR